MSQSLKGQVVLITGASSGFGADAARLFAKEGCSVVLAARRIDRLQSLAEQIQAEGGSALAIPVDVAERREVEGMMQTVFEIFGHVDILFNNAGFGRLDWLENLDTVRDIETQVDVNLLGVLQVTRAVLPHMIARGQGHIINISSVAGLIGAPTYTVYAATKFGVRGFTDALRREVAHFGIKVSGIYPGPAATEFGAHATTGDKKRIHMPKGFTMSSEYVAHKMVQVARNPRRALVIPWWFNILTWLSDIFPGLADLILINYTKKLHPTPPPPATPWMEEKTIPPKF